MHRRYPISGMTGGLLLVLAACSGGSDGDREQPAPAPAPAPAPVPVTKSVAAQFLAQSTFGPSQAEIDALEGGSIAGWLDQQFALPASEHYPRYLQYFGGDNQNRTARFEAWWDHTLDAPDQLRQRVAFALSEIFVVSEQGGGLNNAQHGLAWYYDVLVRHAFGDFRKLLEEVTLAPAMGRYLSMLGSRRPNPATGLRADENFAREVMQLFTLGLNQLNSDGSARLDGSGQPLPTYTQADIENLARVFTGWNFAGATGAPRPQMVWTDFMSPVESQHDNTAKTLVGGVAVPAGLSARDDLNFALDTLFNHPNVGPFIGRQLIQKLVTSNPSPAYVSRVAGVFNDDGRGRRGNLQAVVRAILLDAEARGGNAAHFGKAREPLLALTHLWRATDAQPGATGPYSYSAMLNDFGEAPLSSPSVFNFFSPGYVPAGVIAGAGLVAPEFQLANESSVTVAANRLQQAIYRDFAGNANAPADAVRIELAPFRSLAADPVALVDTLDLLLTGNRLASAYKTALVTHLNGINLNDNGLARAQDALYLILTSPQYAVQK